MKLSILWVIVYFRRELRGKSVRLIKLFLLFFSEMRWLFLFALVLAFLSLFLFNIFSGNFVYTKDFIEGWLSIWVCIRVCFTLMFCKTVDFFFFSIIRMSGGKRQLHFSIDINHISCTAANKENFSLFD